MLNFSDHQKGISSFTLCKILYFLEIPCVFLPLFHFLFWKIDFQELKGRDKGMACNVNSVAAVTLKFIDNMCH